MWSRLKPAFSLVLLAPLIAEYLLGNLSFSQLGLFPIMALMYGAGALVVREVARRNGRGWPTMLMLGLAYGLIEEGLATQSLFNPHYLGLRLLDHGFIPALGIGGPWTTYVIILHVAWSVAVPVGLVEALFSDRRLTPWLGKPGFAVSVGVYVLGVVVVAFGSWQKERFVASGRQLGVTALIAAIVIVAAFVFFHSGPAKPPAGRTPSKWSPYAFGLLAFGTGSLFHLVAQFGSGYLSPVVEVGIALLLPALVIGTVWAALKSGAWDDAHSDALMLGGLLAYCWLGFFMVFRLHGASSIPGQIFPCAIVLALVYVRFVHRRRVQLPTA